MAGLVESLAAGAIVAFARAVTGVRANWLGCTPEPTARVYFANHASHGDFILIWSVLPRHLRRATRPVAGADYWDSSGVRRFIARRVFNAVLIDREAKAREADPIAVMATALDEGSSLILFPEGTRNLTEDRLLPFKSGLYRLAQARPETELVPVWIANLNRVMPKGEFIPVPLLCTVSFGAPMRVETDEQKSAFLERARRALPGTRNADQSMSPMQQTLVLFGGIAAVLLAASLLGYLLHRRYGAGERNATIENLNSRIKAWWVMVVLIGLAFGFGRTGVIVLFALVSAAALREFATLTATRRGDHVALALAFFVVLPLQYYLVWIEWYGLFAVFIPVYVFLLLPIVAALRSDTVRFMERIAEVQWGVMICIFCISHVPALLTLDIPGHEGRGLLLIAFLVIVVQMSDVLQYAWGKLVGRHPIAPGLSPSKTVEGTLGGIATASLVGVGLWWITPFSPWQAGLMALVVTAMGFCGGLVMSAIKRDRGVKDWGWLIAGHGGMLDRIDSVIFAAPVFFHLTRYWWTP